MSFILLIGCSSKMDVNREPDFQSRFLPYFSNAESEQVWLATVNDNMTQEHRREFKLPDEWEVYRIQLEDNTRYIDENGTEISKEEFKSHNYKYKVWTKEKFKPKWSKVLTEEETTNLKVNHLPIYTAIQIQLVQMTDEEYLARDYAEKEGQYALQIYFGEAFDDQEKSLKIQQEVREHIDLTKSKINRIEYTKKASKRKEKLLGIDQYPIFILYDHKKLLLKTTDLQDISSFLTRENASLEEPFNLISEEFGFKPFEIPEGWTVVLIVENYAIKQPFDLLDPEYENVSEHIRIFFGIPAEENVYDLEEYNLNRKDKQVKYAVSAGEYIGSISITKLGSPKDGLKYLPVPVLEEYARTTVQGKEVLYFTHPNDENPSAYIWLSEDEQYRYAFAHDRSRDKTLEETIPLLETLMIGKNNND
jgi:hypothetical protein